MLRLLPLFFVLTAAAADKPLILTNLYTFAGMPKSFSPGVTDPGFTVIATPTDASVNLWSLETGRQVGHFELPKVESKRKEDIDDIMVHSVRPDLKLMLVSTRHLFSNPDWQYGGDMPNMSRAIERLYLISLEDEKNIKLIWTFDGPCAYFGGIQSFQCPGLEHSASRAQISPDRAFVGVYGYLYYSGHLKGERYRGELELAFDLAGKKIFQNEVVYSGSKIVKGVEKSFKVPSEETIIYVRSDAQSCSALRGDKRISFLENCTSDDSPIVLPGDKLAGSRYSNTYKLWDVATGELKAKIEPQLSPNLNPNLPWSESADARVVALLSKSGGERHVQIWNTASGKMIAAGSGTEFKGIDSFTLSPDGRRALYEKTHYGADDYPDYAASILADLGLEGAPAAPAAVVAAKLNVDDLPSSAAKANPDAFAVVIGVEKYRQAGVPAVDYASRDAKTMAAYLGTMGFDAKNVAVLTDAQAGKVDFDKYFGKWLKNRVGPESRVFVYYAGHGAPNPTTGAGYLMPYEADPSYLDETAYPVSQLYSELAKLPTKDVTVVLDACFSGQGERSLIAKGTRPLVALQKTRGPENAAVIAAASGSQISASDHEARHGLLTYHLLAGLHGDADENGDGKITTAELFSYARPAVERAAKLQNVEQTPTVSGDTGAAGTRVWTTLKKP